MSGEEIFLIWSLCIYIGTCLIWLIASYIYCHTHYDEFTIKEMIGYGNARDAAASSVVIFIPLFNTFVLLCTGIVLFCCFMGYLFEKIINIKLK